jgi:hypothetical protein
MVTVKGQRRPILQEPLVILRGGRFRLLHIRAAAVMQGRILSTVAYPHLWDGFLPRGGNRSLSRVKARKALREMSVSSRHPALTSVVHCAMCGMCLHVRVCSSALRAASFLAQASFFTENCEAVGPSLSCWSWHQIFQYWAICRAHGSGLPSITWSTRLWHPCC